MSNKKSILEAPKKMVFKALGKTRKVVKNANNYALHATEDVVTEGITLAEQWQAVGGKALKGGLALTATHQDMVFDALTGVKKDIILSKKRITKLIA